ncbi:MAG: type II CAAX endopeptidase family protein [Bacteroidales bacterium]|jgi:membrane protease YdiL (CAAX protease family)|nr:type II CAAX endopeptidase family protein [Bacteroidales bacterium]
MRKVLFLAYPVWLYVVFSLPALLLSAILYTQGVDIITINSIGAVGMVLLHMRRKRKKMTELPEMPWKRMFLITGIIMIPVATLTAGLTGKAFFNMPLTPWLINCTWSFFWISCCEELLFREFLITRMKERGFPWWLILMLPALLFSLCHRPESVSLLIQRAAMGIILGFLYFKIGDIALCISTHWVYNIILYTFQYFLPRVTTLYSASRAALNVLLCMLSLLGIVVAYSINKSKFAGHS